MDYHNGRDSNKDERPGALFILGHLERTTMQYKIPLVMSPDPDGGYIVTSPLIPELVTEGDTVEEALSNVRDALAAVIETYEDLGRDFPHNSLVADPREAVWFETLVTTR